jgi:hypothetical protein
MSASWQRNLKHHAITKELQESIQAFRGIDAEIELQPMLDYLASIELREAIRKPRQPVSEARASVRRGGPNLEGNLAALPQMR